MSDNTGTVEQFAENLSVTRSFPYALLIQRWLRCFATDDLNAAHITSRRTNIALNALCTLADTYSRKVLEPPLQDDIHASLNVQLRNARKYLKEQLLRHGQLYTLLQEIRDGRPKPVAYWQAFRHYNYFVFRNFLRPDPIVNAERLPHFFLRRVEGVILALTHEDKTQFYVRIVSLIREYVDIAVANYVKYHGPQVEERHFAYMACLMSYYSAFISATLKLSDVLTEFDQCIGERFRMNWYLFNQRIFYQYFYQRPEVQARVSEFCKMNNEPQRPGVINLLSAFSLFVDSMNRLDDHWKIQRKRIEVFNQRNALLDKEWMEKDWQMFEELCRITKSNRWFIRSEKEKALQDLEELDAHLLELLNTTWFTPERVITLAGTCACEDCMMAEFCQVLLQPNHRLRNNSQSRGLQQGNTALYEIPVPVKEVFTAEPEMPLIRLTTCGICQETVLLSAYCKHIVNKHPPTVEELKAEEEEKAAMEAEVARAAHETKEDKDSSDVPTKAASVPRKVPDHVSDLVAVEVNIENRICLVLAEKKASSSYLELEAESSPHLGYTTGIDGNGLIGIGVPSSVASSIKALHGMSKAARYIKCCWKRTADEHNKQFSIHPPLHKHVKPEKCSICEQKNKVSTYDSNSKAVNVLHCSQCCGAKEPSKITISPKGRGTWDELNLLPHSKFSSCGSSTCEEINYHCQSLDKEVTVVIKNRNVRTGKDSHKRTKRKVEKADDTGQQPSILIATDSHSREDLEGQSDLPSSRWQHNGNCETSPIQMQLSPFMLAYGTYSPIVFDEDVADTSSSDDGPVYLEFTSDEDDENAMQKSGPKSGRYTEDDFQSLQPFRPDSCWKILYSDLDNEPSPPAPFDDEIDLPAGEVVLEHTIVTIPFHADELKYQYCPSSTNVSRPREIRIYAPDVRLNTSAPAPGFWFPNHLGDQFYSQEPVEDPPELFVDADEEPTTNLPLFPNRDSLEHSDGLDNACRLFEAFVRDAERTKKTADKNRAEKGQAVNLIDMDKIFEDAEEDSSNIEGTILAQWTAMNVNHGDISMDDGDINIDDIEMDVEKDLGDFQKPRVPLQTQDTDMDDELPDYIIGEDFPPMNPGECEQFLEILRDAAELAFLSGAADKVDIATNTTGRKGNDGDRMNNSRTSKPEQLALQSAAALRSRVPPGFAEGPVGQRQQQDQEQQLQHQQQQQLRQQQQVYRQLQQLQRERQVVPSAAASASTSRAYVVDTVVKVAENAGTTRKDCPTTIKVPPSKPTIAVAAGTTAARSGASVTLGESITIKCASNATRSAAVAPSVSCSNIPAGGAVPKPSRLHSKRTLLRAARNREPTDHDLFVSSGLADRRYHANVVDGVHSCFEGCRGDHYSEEDDEDFDDDDDDDDDFEDDDDDDDDDDDAYDDSAKRRRRNQKPLPEPELCNRCKSPLDSNTHVLCLEAQANKEANKNNKRKRQKAQRQLARKEREEQAIQLKERQRQVEEEKRQKREKVRLEQELEQQKLEEKKRLDRERELVKRAALKAEKEREALKRLEQSRKDKAKEAAKRVALNSGGKSKISNEKQTDNTDTPQNAGSSKSSRKKNRRKKRALGDVETATTMAAANSQEQQASQLLYMDDDNSSYEPWSSDENKCDSDSDKSNAAPTKPFQSNTVELASTIRIVCGDSPSTITVSLKGARPGEDKVLYTIVNGHAEVAELPLELTEAAAKLLPLPDMSALEDPNLTKKQRKKKTQQLNKKAAKLTAAHASFHPSAEQGNTVASVPFTVFNDGTYPAGGQTKPVGRIIPLNKFNNELHRTTTFSSSSSSARERPLNLPDNVNIPSGITVTNVPEPTAASNSQSRGKREQIASGAIRKNSAFSSANSASSIHSTTITPIIPPTSHIHRIGAQYEGGGNTASHSSMYQQSLQRELQKQFNNALEQSARSAYVPFYMSQPKTGSPIVLDTQKLISQGATKKKRNKKKQSGTPTVVNLPAATVPRRNRRPPPPQAPEQPMVQIEDIKTSDGSNMVKLKNPIFQQHAPVQAMNEPNVQLFHTIQRDQLSAHLSEQATISKGENGIITIRRSGLPTENGAEAMSIPDFLRNQPNVPAPLAKDWNTYSLFSDPMPIIPPIPADLDVVDITSSDSNSNNQQPVTTSIYHENDVRFNKSGSDQWTGLFSKLASDVTVLHTYPKDNQFQSLPTRGTMEDHTASTQRDSYRTSNFCIEDDDEDDSFADHGCFGPLYDTASRFPPHVLDRRAPVVPDVTLYSKTSGCGMSLNSVLPQYMSESALEQALALLSIGTPGETATRPPPVRLVSNAPATQVLPHSATRGMPGPIGPPSRASSQNMLHPHMQQRPVTFNRNPWLDQADIIEYRNQELQDAWHDENVFAPKESLDGELDPEDRDVEAFKRFCQQSIPPEHKEKVAHLNVEDIIIKNKNKK